MNAIPLSKRTSSSPSRTRLCLAFLLTLLALSLSGCDCLINVKDHPEPGEPQWNVLGLWPKDPH